MQHICSVADSTWQPYIDSCVLHGLDTSNVIRGFHSFKIFRKFVGPWCFE